LGKSKVKKNAEKLRQEESRGSVRRGKVVP